MRPTPAGRVVRARERGVDHGVGRRTTHGFAFGPHPGPTSLGPLVLCDEHTLAPGAGFAEHAHRELEIVTLVLDGRLEHRGLIDASLGPGEVQHLTAGTGVRHAEHAGPDGARVLQWWLLPAEPGRTPAYRMGTAALTEGALHTHRLDPGEPLEVPRSSYAYVLVAHGTTDLLEEGDAQHVRGEAVRLTAVTPAEVLVWVLDDQPWHPDDRTDPL